MAEASSSGKHPWLARVLGLLVGMTLGVLFLAPPIVFPVDNHSLPRKSIDVLVGVIFLSALPVLNIALKSRQGREQHDSYHNGNRPRLKRAGNDMGRSFLTWQLSVICLAYFSYQHGGWTTESVNLSTPINGALSFLVGILVYFTFLFVLHILLTRHGSMDVKRAHSLQNLAHLWPRSKRSRQYATIGICVLNPFTEELLFRGILVNQFSLIVGSVYLPIAVGLLVNIVNHLYQGPRALITHIPFYFITTGLLFSPLGLIACFGFHFAGDVVPIASMRSNLTWYREHFRKYQN